MRRATIKTVRIRMTMRKRMKIMVCLTTFAFVLSGCTSLRTIQKSSAEIQGSLTHGELIVPGDRIKIITDNGKEYTFKVVSIGYGYVNGKNVAIPIKDIDLIEKRSVSIGRTAMLSGAVFLLIIMSQFGNGP